MIRRLPWAPRLAVLAIAGAVIWLAHAPLAPPAPLSADAPADAFSAARALVHVRRIARAPHPVGSVEHTAVRDYIVGELVRLGVVPEIQRATISQHETAPALELCDVENIVARLPGRDPSRRALLLVGHYDSVPTGPGASDGGHAVAAMLETLRALRAGPPLAHDILLLFSDGEELGQIGARAFAANPHHKDVALALELDARGTRGPAFLVQTSGSGLTLAFGRAVPHPLASSLLDDIAHRLPATLGDSDLGALGIPGLRLAYFDGALAYHSSRDDAAAIDPASLQHQGETLLALARTFGDGELTAQAAPAASYFPAARGWLLWYPSAIDAIVLALTLLGLGWLIARGRRRGQLRLREVALGAARFAAALIACPALAAIGWAQLAPYVAPATPTGEPANAGWYRAALVALAIAGALAILTAGARRTRPGELALGALGALVAVAAALLGLCPGSAYLAVWPALFALIGCALLLSAPTSHLSAVRTLGLAACATPALWLIAPCIHLLFVLLGLHHAAVPVAAVVALVGFTLPALLAATNGLTWYSPALATALGGAALAVGMHQRGATAADPATDSVAYTLDADTHRAYWIADQRPDDAWTSRLIPDADDRSNHDGFSPFTDQTFYQAPAPPAELPTPALRVLDNRVEAGVRRLSLCLATGGPAEALLVYLASTAQIRGAELAGQRFDHEQPTATARWSVRYTGSPRGGFALLLEADASAPIALRLVDQYAGLAPAVVAPARPEQLIQTPFGAGPSDATYVGKTFTDLQNAAPSADTACAIPHEQTAAVESARTPQDHP